MSKLRRNDVTAIVVARAGSRRLPGKALQPFAGSTLIGHKVEQLCACEHIGQVVVGSDSTEILIEAAQHGARTIQRDAYHCDEDRCNANEMIADMLTRLQASGGTGFVLWAHPTNPLISSATYDAAIQKFLDLPLHHDSLVSVNEIRGHCWFARQPVNHAPWRGSHQVAADLKPVHVQNGAIFIQPFEQMKRNGYFHGRSPYLFVTPPGESIDIDTREDYDRAVAAWEAMNHVAA